MVAPVSPLPTSKVVPDGWDAHHRPVATSTMTATCTIRRPATGVYDPATLQYGPADGDTIYSGPCRILMRPRAQNPADLAGQITTTRSYQVSIEWDAATIHVNDVVTVDTASDPRLAGKPLRVTDVQYGSNQWQRDLFCEDFEN